jgi:hypothetical protein
MPTNWFNSDGLYIKFGNNKGVATNAGEYVSVGPDHTLEVTITGTALTTTAAILSDVVILPKNSRIEKVEVIADTLFTSGGSATLDVGLQRMDRSTDIDDDGLVAALPLASINVSGETNVLTGGVTNAGALVGTTVVTYPSFITASYNTAAFTAGVAKVRIYYKLTA